MYRVACVLLMCCGSSGTAIAPAGEPIANTAPKPVVLAFRVLDLRHQGAVLDAQQLTIDGERASLALSGKITMMPADGSPICTRVDGGPEQCKPATTIEMWHEEVAATMTGTARHQGTGFVLDFPRDHPDSPHLVMTCTEQAFDVAPANALVIGADGCAPLTWSAPTEHVKLLACATRDDATPFAAAPGIERVIPANPDCGDRRPMYRRVAADRSVAQALAR